MQKVAAVTGASSGIGLACAAALCKNGYKVYALSRTEGPPCGAVFVRSDVTDPESVAHAFAEIGVREGRLDLLVNNAGAGISGAAEFTSPKEARAQFDVNFFGAAACCSAKLLPPVV